VAASFAMASFLIHELYSLDVWWQIAIGDDILSSRSLPNLDRYATAALGRPYHDSHWLFQVVLAVFDRMLGVFGVQLVLIALWTLTLTLCFRACRRWTSLLPSAVLVFAAAMASVERFLARPEIVTYAMLTAFYCLLQENRFRSLRQLLTLGALQVLWSNCHGLFVLGPFLVGCTWLGELAARVRGDDSQLAAASRALATVTAATLLTPYGIEGWVYAAQLFGQATFTESELFRGLHELRPVFGAAVRASPSFWFFAALLLLGALAGLRTALLRPLSARLWIVAGVCVAALSGRRNLVLFALVAAPFIAESLSTWIPRDWKAPRTLAAAAAFAMAGYAWLPLSGSYYVMMEIPARFGFGATPSFFPHGLPAFLDRVGFEGQILNSNTLGGFILYHGFPQRRPLTDGRWEVYDADLLERILRDSRDPRAWRRLVPIFEIRGIVLAHTSPEAKTMLPTLAHAPDWRLVYYDAAASFWLPSDSPLAAPAVDLGDAAALPEPKRIDDGLILDAFLAGVGARQLRLIHLERVLRLGSRKDLTLVRLGLVQIELGLLEQAQETFEALLRVDPGNRDALNELAFLAYRRGDLEAAALWMRRALETDPNNRELQENYGKVVEAQRRQRATPQPRTQDPVDPR
jgi:hypothetical protein